MTARTTIGYGASVFLVFATAHAFLSGVRSEPVSPRSDYAAVPGPLAIQGAGSCSATACHGSIEPAGPEFLKTGELAKVPRVLRSEHTIWLSRDRHANAFDVLLTPLSKSIALNVWGPTRAAHKEARCLACHSTVNTAAVDSRTRSLQSDGVSCESCHGAAERWIGPHTTAGWRDLDPVTKRSQFGMTALKELDQRAATCAGCHVGAPARDGLPARDVDHDLIAAGHPRLAFEFAAFLANMPMHWREDPSVNASRGNLPARAWAVGQAVSARAALELLAARAGRAAEREDHGQGASWPEFSEYNCFSCHHDLANETWRQRRSDPDVPAGVPAWGSWYFAMTPALARLDAVAGSSEVDKRLGSLRSLMNRTEPDPAAVEKEARGATQALTRWLETLPQQSKRYDAAEVSRFVQELETAEAKAAVSSWDHAAQRYMALQPLRLSLKDLDPRWNDGAVLTELRQLFHDLRFPPGYDSPRRFDPSVTGPRENSNPRPGQ